MYRIIALLTLALGMSLSCDKEEKKPLQYPPLAPNLLTSIETTYHSVHLTWNDNSTDEEKFELEKGLGGNWVLEQELDINVRETIVDGLEPGTMYQFRVYAVNGAGRSEASNTLTVSTPQFNPPPAPTNVQAMAIVPTVVRVTWTDTAPNPVTFVIDRRGESSAWARVGEVGDNETSFNDSTCAPATTYYYRVGATAGSLLTWSIDSAQVTTPEVGTPLAPSDLEAEVLVGIGVRLTWVDHSLDEEHFEIQRGVFGQQLHSIDTVDASVIEYVDSLGANVDVFNYRVRAFNSHGSSGWSNIAEADYRYCSDGAVPICLSNYWIYEVDPPTGSNYEVRRRIAALEYPGGLDYYLVVQDSGVGWGSTDTLYYWRNFDTGLYQDAFPLDDSPAEALLRYPSYPGFWNFFGDSVIVTTSNITIDIGDTTYTNVRVYQRFDRGSNRSLKYYLRPTDVGIILEEEIVGGAVDTRRTLVGRDIRN